MQHYSSMLALAQIELYTDDAEVAWKHVTGQRKALRKSLLLRTQLLKVDSLYLQARTALASAVHAATDDRREYLLRIAERMAGRIAKENMRWSDPLAPLIRAAIAHNHGDESSTAAFLNEAVQGFDLAVMRLRAMTARRRLGQTLGGDRGRELIAQVDDWMSKQEIRNPALMTRMLAPGWRE